MPLSNEKVGAIIILSTAVSDDRVALRGVSIESRLRGLCQRTVVSQTFVNRESTAIEAVYTFPLPAGAAVCGFEILTGDRVLTGAIDELEQAIEKFEKAVAEGHGAYMAEMNRPDVFTTRVGNLKPGQAVTIRLTYVAQLTVNERTIRVSYPTTLAPRYAASAGMDPLEAQMSADALNPPNVLNVPYGLTLKVDVDLGVGLKSVASPTHGVKVTTGDPSHATVSLATGMAEMNRDIVLEVEFAKGNAASVQVEAGPTGDDASFIAATFVPEFGVDELAAPPANETIFLVDCSGSMGGASIAQAKAALALCLRSMNVGDRFNICCFGSDYQLMEREPVVYSEATLKRALEYIGQIDANLGGTELYLPLDAALSMRIVRGVPRSLILLTDGQVTNEPAVVDLGKKYRANARVFSFGIGPAVSESLVKGLAQATGGAAEFISQGERIEEKVLRQFSRMGSPMVSNVTVEWGGKTVEQTGSVSSLFDGDAVAVFARVPGALPHEVSISCIANGKPKRWVMPVAKPATAEPTQTISLLWAMKRMEEVDGDAKIAISKKYGVLCDKTTFIAVEHRSVEERTKGMPELRRVPVLLPRGWGGMDTVDGAGLSLNLRGISSGPPGAAPAMPAPAPIAMNEMTMDARTSSDTEEVSTRRQNIGRARIGLAKLGEVFKDAFSKPAGKSDMAKKAAAPPPPSQAEAAAVPQEPQDELSTILSLQTAAGSFDDSPLFANAKINGHAWPHARLRREAEAIAKGDKKIVATALALVALLRCFDPQKSLWKRALDKARRWLNDNARPEVWAWIEATNL